jgi:plasmid stabilization system protein ParE
VPQVIVTEGAAEGLERCRRFLAAKAPEAARRAGQAIERQFLLLETAPDIGRPFPEMPELRELVIAFGDSGYVALYRHEPAAGGRCGVCPGIPAPERGGLLIRQLPAQSV